jgi:hypothetical protein
MNLYDITTEFSALEEMLALDGGELTESHAELEALVSEFLVNKTDNMVSFIQKLEDEMEIAAAHIKRIQAYKKVRENAIESLKDYTKTCLNKLDKKKVQGVMGEISLRAPVKVVDILNENEIAPEFTRIKVELDKTKIAKALKDGEEVKGARLIDGKQSVTFKMKSVK